MEGLWALVIGNGANAAENTVCKLELSTALQSSGMRVYRPCVLQHLFWQLFGPNIQLQQMGL